MTERYPDDATLLALTQDPATGVEYIPTGRSPYYLEFRKLLQRLLIAAGRANDLRVYQDGDLSIGVRGGRCFVGGAAHDYAGAEAVAVTPGVTTHVWLNATGALATGTSGLPTDRLTFIPLAAVVAGSSAITQVDDLRGEAFLSVSDLAGLGLDVTPAQINTVLDGASATVDATALNTLTAGPFSSADSEHRHLQVAQSVSGEAYFVLLNTGSGGSANAALALSVPGRFASDLVVLRGGTSGHLTQRLGATTYQMVGSLSAQHRSEGSLAASQTGKLIGAAPIDGVVSAVLLSVGTNIVSSTSTDGVEAVAKVNGTALTTTHPQITSAAGSGFRSTAQSHGTAGVVKTDGTQNVTRGDVLSVDLNRTAAGSVSTEAANAVVIVVVRADKPE